MATDQPDDLTLDEWLRKLPSTDDVGVEGPLGRELEVEHERLFAEHGVGGSRSRLDSDLEELEGVIADVQMLRHMGIDAPAHKFDRFETISTVRGGMGLVIKARDPQLDRIVAIKLWMRPGPQAHEALLAEAKTLAKLQHPNVVAVHEIGVLDGRVYFVMDWIEGVDGHRWLRRRPSWREVRRVLVAAGAGLAAAHDAGIHHRDLKPANILIGDDGRVVVADFGLAASLQAKPERDDPRARAGTPSYMAPERLWGKRGDARSDQWAFCATVWRALFGQRPFGGETIEELFAATERGQLQQPAESDVPSWFVDVIRKGLAFDPDDRHADMHALIAAMLDEPAELAGTGRGKARATRDRGPYFALGFLSALVGILGLHAMRSAPAFEPELAVAEAVELEPYQVLLGLITTDDFEKAERYWFEHQSEWTDAQSLAIAETYLARGRALVQVSPAKAEAAAFAAIRSANRVKRYGTTAEFRAAGGRLVADARARLQVDHPSDAGDQSKHSIVPSGLVTPSSQ